MYKSGFEHGVAGFDSSICDIMYLLLSDEEYNLWLDGYVDGSFYG